MSKLRIVFLIVVLLLGTGLILLLIQKKTDGPLKPTMAPAFETLGKPVDTVNKALTRSMPIDSLDEKKYGEAILKKIQWMADLKSEGASFLDEVISRLSQFASKPFKYTVLLIDNEGWGPNAFALPGGVIIVTRPLLELMENDGEIASILAHEMGHIERSHCLSLIRFELAAKKIGVSDLGRIADFTMNFFLRNTYSKTQENEADEYAFEVIKKSKYDPSAVADAFSMLLNYTGETKSTRTNIIQEYRMTHPYLALREAKFREEAKEWWATHQDEKNKRVSNKINFKENSL